MRTLFVIIALTLYLSGNFYVFYRLWQAFPWHAPLLKWGLVLGGTLLVTSMILSFLLSGALPGWLTGALYAVGTTWIFVFFYLLLATVARDIFLLTNHLWHFTTVSPRVSYAIMASVVAAVLVAGHLRYLAKDRVELIAETGKTAGNGLTLVFISDLHLGHGIGALELARWVDLINAEHPDAVLIGGDIIDNDIRPVEAGGAAEWLRKIQAPLGVYACPGNHEYISGVERSLRFISGAGVNVLRDTVVEVGNAFLLVGRDDRSNPRRAALSALLEGRDRSLPIIVLDHQPMQLDEAARAGIDLQLSGHTHHGQVWPISWITSFLYELPHGYLRKGNTGIYVTSGIGLWGGKFRIGTRSEYVVIHLR
ncbi:MAG: metallophosphoesterase [Odoribacteraceae bacterium]|jgi:predicted MPP superfamily phosphohydrolase|nr:metallophosphoesterase [Odoribacteraceae bacterium]